MRRLRGSFWTSEEIEGISFWTSKEIEGGHFRQVRRLRGMELDMDGDYFALPCPYLVLYTFDFFEELKKNSCHFHPSYLLPVVVKLTITANLFATLYLPHACKKSLL